MSNEFAPHRMHLNVLPLLIAPGIGLVAYASVGLLFALSSIAIWCSIVTMATTVSAIRCKRNMSHSSWQIGARGERSA